LNSEHGQNSVVFKQHCVAQKQHPALDRCFSATVVSIQQSTSTRLSSGSFVVFPQQSH